MNCSQNFSSFREHSRRFGGSVVRFAGVLACIAGLLVTFSGCSHRDSDTLTIGMELAYPPFEMSDEKGQPAGVSVDLAKALAAQLGKKLVIENTAFDGLIPSLKTGRIDAIISSMTATPERAESIDFSDPYLKTGLCLLVGKNSGIQSIQDADREGGTIAVKKGTTGYAYATAHITKAKLLVLDKEAACVLEVIQGKADAFIYDQMSVFKHWQRNPETTRALLKPFKEEVWAVGIRKGNDTLRNEVNAFLAKYKAQGGFDTLGDRWLKEQKEAFLKLGHPFLF